MGRAWSAATIAYSLQPMDTMTRPPVLCFSDLVAITLPIPYAFWVLRGTLVTGSTVKGGRVIFTDHSVSFAHGFGVKPIGGDVLMDRCSL